MTVMRSFWLIGYKAKRPQASDQRLSKEPSYIASIIVCKNFALPSYFCKTFQSLNMDPVLAAFGVILIVSEGTLT